jgi:hypothetical protein
VSPAGHLDACYIRSHKFDGNIGSVYLHSPDASVSEQSWPAAGNNPDVTIGNTGVDFRVGHKGGVKCRRNYIPHRRQVTFDRSLLGCRQINRSSNNDQKKECGHDGP